MLQKNRLAVLALAAALALAGTARAADLTASLTKGTPELKSAGALAFGPEGILFVGDSQAATIYAIDTEDRTPAKGEDRPKVEGVNEKIAGMLGVDAKALGVNDLAVNPISGNTYLSLSRGKGADAKPAIVRVDRKGKISEFPLKDVKFAKTTLPNAAGRDRYREAITQIAFIKDRIYVAGLSNEQFTSKLRVIPFPFKEADDGTSVEIFHGNHGKLETASPIRTFTAYDIKGETNLLAAYTCTPLVKIPVTQLKPGEKVKGTTVAELGNQNRPLDMIVYQKGGKDYILMANDKRGVMKISVEGIATIAPIEKKVSGTAGLKYETVATLKGVTQLDRFDKDHAIILAMGQGGAMNLETIELP